MALVVDASATLGLYFPDEITPALEDARQRLATGGARVPILWWFEIRNSLVVAERRGRVDASQSAEILAQLEALPVRFDRVPESDAVLALARTHCLTVYDAAYLELALRLGATLATLDRQLARAARAAKVPLLGEGDVQ
jgi:predicted nucleic acid-binding protein